MIRVLVENILLFLLPTAVYFAYHYLTQGEDRSAVRAMNDAPLFGLFAAGAAVVVTVLVLFTREDGGKPGQHYQPPVFKDGRIEPGQIK